MSQKAFLFILFIICVGSDLSSQNIEAVDTTTEFRGWGVSVNPTSLLDYVGSASSGLVELPVWNGSAEDQINIFHWKPKSKTQFLLYGIGMSLRNIRSTEIVPALNENGEAIDGEFVEDNYEENAFRFGLYLSKNKWIGENRLKGRLGYFSRLNVSVQNVNFLSENPLESMIGDTLSFNSGRTFEFQVGLTGGVSYFVSDHIFISGDSDISFHLSDTRNSVLRQVEFDPVVSPEPFISNVKGAERSSGYGIDIRFRPTLTLTFLF